MRIASSLLVLIATAVGASAEPNAVFEVERHVTSDALDGPLARSDAYSVLRGTLTREFDTSIGALAIIGRGEASRYDRLSIEDDRAVGVEASLTRRISAQVELRGTVGYRLSDAGDDLVVGDRIVGTRAQRRRFVAGVQAGIDLGGGVSAILGITGFAETAGATRFEDDLIPAQRLDPDRRQLGHSLLLTRTHGKNSSSLLLSVVSADAEPLGSPPVALDFREFTVRGELNAVGSRGETLALAMGLQALEGGRGLVRFVRPVLAAKVKMPIAGSFTLSAHGVARFETSDMDDPLGSYLRRTEIEASLSLSEAATLGAGLFSEIKSNLLLENQERRRGLYGEGSYEVSPGLRFTGRVDWSETFETVLDNRWRTLDVSFALSRKL